MTRNCLLGGLCAVLLAACSTAPLHTSTPPAPPPKTAADAIIPEAWVSEPVAGNELDSLVAWPTEDGQVWLIATAKATHHLAIYDADTGQRLRTVGASGDAVGQFNRPNGIAVFGDLLFVAERDNHRVQAFRLPEFAPLGAFGADVLRAPYGLWVHETAPGELELFVTDSFMADFRTMKLPPMEELVGRVKRFQVRVEEGGKLETRLLGQFGDTGAAGALRMVESIAGDPAHGRLLIAEEDRRVGSTLRDYTLAGHYNGRSLATFDADAEGITLWACSADAGYWVAVDQLTPTRFRVFDRATLAPAGVFSGKVTSNTDGETVYAMPTARFPAGALFALHNDVSLAAFDLRDIARALDLQGDCPR
ncbi:3-phytase [Pseudoxanthomonas sp. 3HH-4]|uniref:phytase n=1 Tax=Pseudoxanthomonas sp. 3HH-4 TaxID=1690214 RepID=UPI00114E9724|nr:phytase [Pseudoxanthomonas sp. 3HH-4]TQM17558.1 3-phytase [Pseudoxanthomonas sp. 3HH-4]